MLFSFGDVVLVPFPFTNQTTSKHRPAVIISTLDKAKHYLIKHVPILHLAGVHKHLVLLPHRRR